MTKNDQTKQWSKPELVKLGTMKDVAVKSNTQNDGQSGNFTFGAAS